MFKAGDIVVSKDEFIGKHETLQDTIGIVISYNSDTDYLVIGELHPLNNIPPTYSMRGCFYRLISKEEMATFNL